MAGVYDLSDCRSSSAARPQFSICCSGGLDAAVGAGAGTGRGNPQEKRQQAPEGAGGSGDTSGQKREP